MHVALTHTHTQTYTFLKMWFDRLKYFGWEECSAREWMAGRGGGEEG